MANPVLLRTELEQELKGRPGGDKQLDRILMSSSSEDLLTWNIFAPLRRVGKSDRWMPELLKEAFGRSFAASDFDAVNVRLWHGRHTREYFPPPEHGEWLKRAMTTSSVESLGARAAKGGSLEGPTEVDIVLESTRLLVFIEAKYLSDVSCDTSYDTYRDQITRSLDVGTYQAAKRGKSFAFVLLTPGRYERARLYWYKMADYQSDSQHLRRALPYRAAGPRKLDFEKLRASIGWVLWKSMIDIWVRTLDEVEREGVVPWSPQDRATVYRDFVSKGLIAGLDR